MASSISTAPTGWRHRRAVWTRYIYVFFAGIKGTFFHEETLLANTLDLG
jgi:hypothetical protein